MWKQIDPSLAMNPAAYYIDASEKGGEPPGRWWGPAAEALGFAPGEMVEREPYELLFGQRKAPDGTPLGRPPGRNAKAAEIYVRLLAAELGAIGVRVNGINPDGVVRGSGIFAGGWGAKRAAVYGVPEEDLGAYYAQRTLLKKEVLPEHIAAAVFALTGGDLPLTTGLLIPVDAGVAAAFLR